METEVTPLADFTHGHYTLQEGKVKPLPEHVALELEKHGLVRINKVAPALRNQMAPEHLGKAPADGEGTPSASLEAARHSLPLTHTPPKSGKTKHRRSGT